MLAAYISVSTFCDRSASGFAVRFPLASSDVTTFKATTARRRLVYLNCTGCARLAMYVSNFCVPPLDSGNLCSRQPVGVGGSTTRKESRRSRSRSQQVSRHAAGVFSRLEKLFFFLVPGACVCTHLSNNLWFSLQALLFLRTRAISAPAVLMMSVGNGAFRVREGAPYDRLSFGRFSFLIRGDEERAVFCSFRAGGRTHACFAEEQLVSYV